MSVRRPDDPLHSVEMQAHLQRLADMLVLGALLEELRARYGRYELLEHWTQGEFIMTSSFDSPTTSSSSWRPTATAA